MVELQVVWTADVLSQRNDTNVYSVQMVMMHELAHCKQMNHSKFFWQVRNQYADQMKELWAKRYEGEGLWGRGQNLQNGAFVHDRMPEGEDIPEHLCGGTYRRARGRKRKRGQDGDKPKLSYAERQQKRIAKKFGIHGEGQGLGEDDLVRGALEQGKRHQGKPKVAGSKRGRELRANAALARFEAAKIEQQRAKQQTQDLDSGSETESDDDEWANGLPILDKLGSAVQDEEGRDMIQVCGDEGDDAMGGHDELEELRQMGSSRQPKREARKLQKKLHEDSETESEADDCRSASHDNTKWKTRPPEIPREDSETEIEPDESQRAFEDGSPKSNGAARITGTARETFEIPAEQSCQGSKASAAAPLIAPPMPVTTCPVCSLENDLDSPTCLACANVLKPKLVSNSWRCKNDTCKGSKYLNAGDAGRCGLCAAPKPAGAGVSTGNGPRPLGLTGSEVLRWD